MKTAILLINIGTPKSFKAKDVGVYLSQFLGDKNVLQMPWIPRWLLVNLIIVPFRSFKSGKKYKEIWTKEGSPLLDISYRFKTKLQQVLSKDHKVYIGMRYGVPNVKKAVKEILRNDFDKLIILPLYPQFAISTTYSSLEIVEGILKKAGSNIETKIIKQFYSNQKFFSAFANRIRNYKLENFDHILFSFHGLPLKQVYQSHNSSTCEEVGCKEEINKENQFCYQATCYATAKLIADELKLHQESYSICFQSRFSKNWLNPFADEVIVRLAKQGIKNILVICPSFVTDCLETIHEIGIEYTELFQRNGGINLQLVESLNDGDDWVDAVKVMVDEI